MVCAGFSRQGLSQMDGLNVNPLMNVSKSMTTKVPWYITLSVALLALWSLTRSSAKIHKMAEIAGSSNPIAPTYENVDLSELHRAMDEVQQADSIQMIEDNTVRELLQHPVVQQHIEAEVKQRVQTQASKQARQTRGRQPQTRTARRKDIQNQCLHGRSGILFYEQYQCLCGRI